LTCCEQRRGKAWWSPHELIMLQLPFPMPELYFSSSEFFFGIRSFLLLRDKKTKQKKQNKTKKNSLGSPAMSGAQEKHSCTKFFIHLFFRNNNSWVFILSNLFMIFTLLWQMNWWTIWSHDIKVCLTLVLRKMQMHGSGSFTFFQASPYNSYHFSFWYSSYFTS